MQAIGLKLEENGTVLALGEGGGEGEGRPAAALRAGGKWERVPETVLRRLDTAAKVNEHCCCWSSSSSSSSTDCLPLSACFTRCRVSERESEGAQTDRQTGDL